MRSLPGKPSFAFVLARLSVIMHSDGEKASRCEIVPLVEPPAIALAAYPDMVWEASAHIPAEREWLPVPYLSAQLRIWIIQWPYRSFTEVVDFRGAGAVKFGDNHCDGYDSSIVIGVRLDGLESLRWAETVEVFVHVRYECLKRRNRVNLDRLAWSNCNLIPRRCHELIEPELHEIVWDIHLEVR